jgi:hypothetical protein
MCDIPDITKVLFKVILNTYQTRSFTLRGNSVTTEEFTKQYLDQHRTSITPSRRNRYQTVPSVQYMIPVV